MVFTLNIDIRSILLLYVLYSDEMTAWIKMESTITETWSILDVTALSHPFDTHTPWLGFLSGQATAA